MGSRAIAVSPDGKNVYVASSKSDAIAIFKRNARTGTLTQPPGTGRLHRRQRRRGCATAVGLDGPNSVAVSPDGLNVYATSRASNTISVFRRNRVDRRAEPAPRRRRLHLRAAGPGLRQRPCPGRPRRRHRQPRRDQRLRRLLLRQRGRGLRSRPRQRRADPAGGQHRLHRRSDRRLHDRPRPRRPGGHGDQRATAPTSTSPAPSPTPSRCWRGTARPARSPRRRTAAVASSTAPLTGCTTGVQLSGANAVAFNPGGDVYVTSLFSNSVTSFSSLVLAAA